MIFYESRALPPRPSLTLCRPSGFGPSSTVNRELTKLPREVRRGTWPKLAEWAESERIRGEIVDIVEGAQA